MSSRRFLTVLLATATAAIMPLAVAGSADACSCITGSRMAMYERATDVFLGKVVEGPPAAVADANASGESGSAAGWAAAGVGRSAERQFQIDVGETLKGSASGHVDVDTPGDEAACGYPFEVGKTYVVFAHRGAHGLHTDLCMGTVTGEGLAPTLERARELSAFGRTHRMPVQSH